MNEFIPCYVSYIVRSFLGWVGYKLSIRKVGSWPGRGTTPLLTSNLYCSLILSYRRHLFGLLFPS